MSKVKEKWTLKRILKEVVITLVLFFIISQVMNFIRKPDVQENIYAYELKDIQKQSVDFSNYKDKPLIVHFWGTWCPTCRLEASNIDELSKKYNVISIAVNSGSDEVLKAYMVENELTYRVINDAKSVLAQKFDIGVYPTTLLYNAKGELKFSEVGYSTTLGLQARMELIK